MHGGKKEGCRGDGLMGETSNPHCPTYDGVNMSGGGAGDLGRSNLGGEWKIIYELHFGRRKPAQVR